MKVKESCLLLHREVQAGERSSRELGLQELQKTYEFCSFQCSLLTAFRVSQVVL